MSTTLIIAIVAITLALVFYTCGVFAERKAHTLKRGHVIIFWLGLICDTTGTMTMMWIARENNSTGLGIHGVTGTIAILLMVFHAIWATITYVRKNAKQMKTFHKFSLFVWLIWLIPYFIGMFMGM